MGIKDFAPVIIPTLCRYEHLRVCIESLMRCTHAEKTDVYIGLDYPQKESHWEGYKKIKDYLDSIKNSNCFKNLIVICRERNYGIGKEGNAEQMINYISKKYDRWIFSEDDNIFAPAFLDYMNQALELFNEDKTVLAICGYRHFYDIRYDNNNVYRQNVDFSAWGYGMWRNRWQTLINLDKNWFKDRFSIKTLFNLKFKQGNNRLLDYIGILKSNDLWINDNTMSIYMALTGSDVVMPTKSLVRNCGWDGSGVNCKTLDDNLIASHQCNELYDKMEYDINGSGLEYYKYNNRIYIKQSYARISNLGMLKLIICKINKFFHL